MELDDACQILRRYRDWRRGVGVRDFEAAGFKPGEVGAALDEVLAALPVLRKSLASTQAQLAKCRVQRERFHAQLRSKKSC
jgi:hypothetical protein